MANLDEIIKREVNPFDSVTFTTGNFWRGEVGGVTSTVNSIHQKAINQIAADLDLVVKDNYTRSVLLQGDSGCGKSYLLARLKKTFNPKAFFAYIDSCSNSDYIWRHTLRHLVDSLMERPVGEQESQLLLWLQGLSAFSDGGLMKKLLGERRLFISNLSSTYPTDIYQRKDFFGVLYQLTDPDLFLIACDWLRGENLDQEDIRSLGVNSVIDSEEAAKGIVGNFGRIADATKPIVLCFDQLDNGSRLPDGNLDLSPYFKVNTTLHNNYIKNFLVVISIVSDTWRTSKKNLPQSDLSRLNQSVTLKDITLEQVKALWALRLYPLHRQAKPKPSSPIEPLNGKALQQRFPGGKANLRNALMLGRELFLQYIDPNGPEDTLAAFKLLWRKELKENQAKIDRIRKFSSLDLIAMLKQALKALGIQIIKDKILPIKTYSRYFFSCQLPGRRGTRGICWNEEPNMTNFYYTMKACQITVDHNCWDSLILIRGEKLGKPQNKGYKLFKEIFGRINHHHIIPQLESVYYLRTYQTLAGEAISGDLVVGSETPNLPELEALMQQGNILQDCPLLQDLEIVPPSNRGTRENVSQQTKVIANISQETKVIAKVSPEGGLNSQHGGRVKLPAEAEVKDFVLDLVKTQKFISVKVLIESCAQEQQFTKINTSVVKQIIHELCEAKLISIINPQATVEDELVCLIPQSNSRRPISLSHSTKLKYSMSYITKAKEISTIISKLTSYPILWLDTEVADWKTYNPRLSLIQVLADPEKIYVFDVLNQSDLVEQFINKIMMNGQIEKVFHNAPFDLRYLGKKKAQNVTCTLKIARKISLDVLGTPNRKLKTLAAKLGFENVDTESQSSDWGKRPLSKQQLKYSKMDVVYLAAVHRRLLE